MEHVRRRGMLCKRQKMTVHVRVFDGLGYFFVLHVDELFGKPLLSKDKKCLVQNCPPIAGYKYTTPGSCMDYERCDDAPPGQYHVYKDDKVSLK